MIKVPLIHLVIILTCAVSAGCSKQLSDNIIGRWDDPSDPSDSFEFFADGAFLMKTEGKHYSGRWVAVANDRIKVESHLLGTSSILLFEDISFSGTSMHARINETVIKLTRTQSKEVASNSEQQHTVNERLAKNDVVQIATALTAYETEFGRWPTNDPSEQTVCGDMLNALLGNNDTANPRHIQFIEEEKGRMRIDEQTGKRTFFDPWHQPYRVVVDQDSDNVIIGVPGDRNSLPKRIAVWSIGRPQRGDSADDRNYKPNSEPEHFLKSWK